MPAGWPESLHYTRMELNFKLKRSIVTQNTLRGWSLEGKSVFIFESYEGEIQTETTQETQNTQLQGPVALRLQRARLSWKVTQQSE